MTKITWQKRTYIPKTTAVQQGEDAFDRFCELEPKQPLLLHNTGDFVAVTDVLGGRAGCVAAEHAAEIASRMQNEVVLARVTDFGCNCVQRDILVWSEGEEVEDKSSEGSTISASEVLEKVTI